ncbi:hypothetical protein [Veronia pacifica]|uniref:Uncharacterized protein n=1 Tax=Veronia pacifica TaxID=1080227 RepID=A0A1C3EBH4_9GAMM|nr:hypothetical protein [Veronia pacifica]ODA30593.1 hypothetical protein A8L45_19870 [Veronia pacifica]
MKKILLTSVIVSLVGCGGGGDSSPTQQTAMPAVPKMSLTPLKGTVANTQKSRPAIDSYAVYEDPADARSNIDTQDHNFFGEDNINTCIAYMHLTNITANGYDADKEKEYSKYLSQQLIEQFRDAKGISGADGFVNQNGVEAKDWISHFYYKANNYDCDSRTGTHYDSVEREKNGIVNLRLAFSAKDDDGIQFNRVKYTGWQNDSKNNDVAGMTKSSTKGGLVYNHKLRSFKTKDVKSVDLVDDIYQSTGENNKDWQNLSRSYFSEGVLDDHNYQIVGGNIISAYGKSPEDKETTYYAVNMVSAFVDGVGTQVSWCTVGTGNKADHLPQSTFNSIRESGDMGAAYCDPIKSENSKTQYYDLTGQPITEIGQKNFVDNAVRALENSVDKFSKTTTLYSGKSQQEYFDNQQLANEVDQLKVDLAVD